MNRGRPREFDEDAVLESVMQSFWRHGFENTTFENLVADTGLSRSSLYNNFGGKDQLFKRAFNRYIELEESTFLDSLNNENDGARNLRALIQTFREPVDPKGKSCLTLKTTLGNAADEKSSLQDRRISKGMNKVWEAFRGVLQRMKPKKAKSITDEERAAMFVAIKYGISVICRNGRNKDLVDAITDGTAKFIEQR